MTKYFILLVVLSGCCHQREMPENIENIALNKIHEEFNKLNQNLESNIKR